MKQSNTALVAAAIVKFLETEGKNLSEEKREGLQGTAYARVLSGAMQLRRAASSTPLVWTRPHCSRPPCPTSTIFPLVL